MLKKILCVVMLLLSLSSVFNLPFAVSASQYENLEYSSQIDIYTIYDEDFNVLFQKDEVYLGDGYMSPERKYYEVVFVDDDKKMGIAKFIRYLKLPNVGVSHAPKPIALEDRVICMYMSHNDESYVPTDGVDSVYGNGGIKDVALAFKKELENNLIDVYLDDTLHIPHDSKAYARSKVTAESLYNKYKPDAIFDIHRDATSRKFYVADVNGRERGRVRIVIGKSNPNMALNEEFALYVVAVANELYPWLITDIYYGGGHYNQSIDGKSLLFEMGTYLIEKELIIESMDELADVVTTALYNTTINEDSGNLTINGVEDENNVVVKDYIDEKQKVNYSVLAMSIAIVIMASVSLYAIFLLVNNMKQAKKLTNNKK